MLRSTTVTVLQSVPQLSHDFTSHFAAITSILSKTVNACELRIAELGAALDHALQIHSSSPPTSSSLSSSNAPTAANGSVALSDSAAADIAARLIDLTEVAETAAAALSHRIALVSVAAAARAAVAVGANVFSATAEYCSDGFSFPSLSSHQDQPADRHRYEEQLNQPRRRGGGGIEIDAIAPAGLRETLDSILAPVGGGCSQMPPLPHLPAAGKQPLLDESSYQQLQIAAHQSRQRNDGAFAAPSASVTVESGLHHNPSICASASCSAASLSDDPNRSGIRPSWTLVPASPIALTALHSLVVSSPSSSSSSSSTSSFGGAFTSSMNNNNSDDDATSLSGRRRYDRRDQDQRDAAAFQIKTNLLASFGSSSSSAAASDSNRLVHTVARARDLLIAHFLAADVACVQSHLDAFTFAPPSLSSSSSSLASSLLPRNDFASLPQLQQQRMAHWAVLALTMPPSRLWREFTRVRHRAVIAHLSESISTFSSPSSSSSSPSLPVVAIQFAEFASILLFAARLDWPVMCAHFSPLAPLSPSFEANLVAHFASLSSSASSSTFSFASSSTSSSASASTSSSTSSSASSSSASSSLSSNSTGSSPAIACLLALYVEPVACAARRLLMGARNTNACLAVLETLVGVICLPTLYG